MAQDVSRYGADVVDKLNQRIRDATPDKDRLNGEALGRIVAEYPDSNVAGQSAYDEGYLLMREGKLAEAEAMLHRTASQWADSVFPNGVQVGPYAQALEAELYAREGKVDQAQQLAEQILAQYPDALGWDGLPLRNRLEKLLRVKP